MNNFKRRFLFTAITLFCLGMVVKAQGISRTSSNDSIFSVIEQMQNDQKKSNKLKISGFVHAEYQHADTAGIQSMAGGSFNPGTNDRFMIRRAFLKFAYAEGLTDVVLQVNMTEKGIGLKDAYIRITDPWFKTSGITAGLFNRPFGYEITYISNLRESPERSRVFQILFPGERDLGAMLTLQPSKTSSFNFLHMDLGIFNGNGINVETDKYKDFIGHLSAESSSSNNLFNWGIGASLYEGGFASVTSKAYSLAEVDGAKAFMGKDITIGERVKRQYAGIDGQIKYNGKAGATKIMAEFLTGTQPASYSSTSSLTNAASGDVYSRKFNGYYVYFIQNILQSPLQLVIKYDVYDPNIEISGNEIGQTVAGGVSTGSSDIKYSTLGFGMNYRLSQNIRLLAYYDVVRNETTSHLRNSSTLSDLSHDRKDNVFTLVMQYKF